MEKQRFIDNACFPDFPAHQANTDKARQPPHHNQLWTSEGTAAPAETASRLKLFTQMNPTLWKNTNYKKSHDIPV